jgi:hypothetical protein
LDAALRKFAIFIPFKEEPPVSADALSSPSPLPVSPTNSSSELRRAETDQCESNLDAGNISPQYHLVFDDTFSTAFSDGQFNADVWDSLATSNLKLHDDVPSTVPSTLDFVDAPTTDPNADILSFIDNLPEQPPPSTILPSLPTEFDHQLPSFDGPTSSFRSPLTMNRPLSSPKGGQPLSVLEGVSPMPTSSPEGCRPSPSPEGGPSSSPEGGFRKSSRLRKPVDRLNLLNSTRTIDPKVFEMFDSTPCPKGSKQITFRKTDQPSRVTRESINQQFLSKLWWDQFTHTCTNAHSALGSFISEHQRYLSKSNLLDYLNPAALATMTNKDDNPTFKEAMAGPDAGGFTTAMGAEILTLTGFKL